MVKFSPCILHMRSPLSSVKTMAKYSHTFERIIFHVDVLVVTVAVICYQISASATAARNSKAIGKRWLATLFSRNYRKNTCWTVIIIACLVLWNFGRKFNCRMEVVSLSNEQVNFLFVIVPQFTKSIVSFRRIRLAKCSKSNKSWRLM